MNAVLMFFVEILRGKYQLTRGRPKLIPQRMLYVWPLCCETLGWQLEFGKGRYTAIENFGKRTSGASDLRWIKASFPRSALSINSHCSQQRSSLKLENLFKTLKQGNDITAIASFVVDNTDVTRRIYTGNRFPLLVISRGRNLKKCLWDIFFAQMRTKEK